ncbi:ubiquinone biosynthesis accessory factor UbiJ [Nitrosovibrio tenuis]|uniref:Ubiquinone biosynthesis accessory factor UbiJ n=1 Tax=Nitrosovibrio tenuis TaxID=1233 RepID=A0A1H7KNA1_9PROT|nr:SCP2 sterol-binding domain-containing protein [Nitrosovibrio tenuis]SEK87990.1 ubiquinone biosynthesis protein UbiJ [Nitrosovibrio tenuis]
MLASVAIAPFNHLLRGESWARKRLQPCAGKTARFRLPPFPDLALTVQASGEISPAAKGTPDDAVVTLVPGLLPRLLARDEDAYREIRISGDSEFAEEIIRVGKNLHWDAEQDLSVVMGDILAHRVAQAGQSLVHWHTDTIRNLLQTLMEYWTEEQPLLAKPAKLHEFIREVDALQNEAAHLEQRVNALAAK